MSTAIVCQHLCEKCFTFRCTFVDIRAICFFAGLGSLLLVARSGCLLAGVLFLRGLAGNSGCLGGGLLIGGFWGHCG